MKFDKYTVCIYWPADGHLGHSQSFSIKVVMNLFVMSPGEQLQIFSGNSPQSKSAESKNMVIFKCGR